MQQEKLQTKLAELVAMQEADIAIATALIGKSMNESEAAWAKTTMERHFKLQKIGITDGRHYYLVNLDNTVVGIVGLHHYEWGPPENVWLGWFAVSPDTQGRGLGTSMIEKIQKVANRLGFTKLFVETYSSPTFERARKFYQARGFSEVGGIRDYLQDGIHMVVYSKNLIP